jgi:glutathione S-transferase
MQLFIGNKNYSSWSMRPWVLMRHFGIPFDEVMVRFDGFQAGSSFKQRIEQVAPTGRVPVLVDDGLAVWDTLAIAEYLAERFPQHPLWPRGTHDRARARSLCAEMHAGFSALRGACPQNIETSLPEIGRRVLQEQAAVRSDLQRLQAMWSETMQASGGPFLFGAFGIADAYFAPVAGRIRTYGLPVDSVAQGYVERVFGSPGVAAWVRDALAERDFLAFEEPYRTSRDG